MREPLLLRTTRLCSMALGVGAFFLGIPQPVSAEAPPSAAESNATETRVGEAKLDAFARSYVRLAEVRKEYAGELGVAGEPHAEAAEETVEVLRDEGLSAQEYNRILDAVNADPELRSVALRKIESHR
jgi:hypothetical protein